MGNTEWAVGRALHTLALSTRASPLLHTHIHSTDFRLFLLSPSLIVQSLIDTKAPQLQKNSMGAEMGVKLVKITP